MGASLNTAWIGDYSDEAETDGSSAIFSDRPLSVGLLDSETKHAIREHPEGVVV